MLFVNNLLVACIFSRALFSKSYNCSMCYATLNALLCPQSVTPQDPTKPKIMVCKQTIILMVCNNKKCFLSAAIQAASYSLTAFLIQTFIRKWKYLILQLIQYIRNLPRIKKSVEVAVGHVVNCPYHVLQVKNQVRYWFVSKYFSD